MDGQGGRFDSPFFRSKFRVPAAPDHFVHRERVASLLDDLATYPVTAVVAPAGAGKTTLTADWLRTSARPAAWLALDETDRDPGQLCAAVTAAVDQLAPGTIDPAPPGGPPKDLQVLAESLDPAGLEPGVLVLDDVHRIDEADAACTELLTFLEHKPSWLHVVLLSRRRPPLPIDRLRAGGTLADVTFDVLRFTDAEAAEMLAGLCPDTETDELAALAHWADGWAAALQLAALAVRSHRAPQLPESDRLVDSYVWHEVLRAERPELVGVLLSTAVVDRLNYGLAEALTGRPDAGEMLVEAEERGLFVTGLAPGGWFEVHGLVRELLLAELERRWPDQLHDQHARAARWFESMGDPMAALDHWLSSDQPAQALRLLAAISVSLVDSGRTGSIDRVIARIPAEVSGADAASRVRFAWCRLLLDRPGFLDALAAAEVAVADEAGSGQEGLLEVLRSTAAYVTGDWPACVDRARSGLAHLDDVQGVEGGALADPIGRFGWSLVSHGLALAESWDDADQSLADARAAVTHDHGRRLAHETAHALGLALSGHPLDVVRVAAGLRPGLEATDMRTLRGVLDVAEAVAARELGDREAAEPALSRIAALPSYPSTYVPVLALLELVQSRLDDGDVPAAEQLFQRAEELVAAELPGVSGRTWLARTGVLVALAKQSPSVAERWVERVEDPFWRPLSEARVRLAEGREPDAAEAARRAHPRCTRHEVVRSLVLARALSADDKDAAAKSVDIAIDLAADHGLLQSVASECGPVLELVELAAWRVPDAWMDRLRRVVLPESSGGTTPAMFERLTDRERDVLRLLPSRLTMREIAAELYVSPNTLKFHLRVIYRKLGVNSRGEAVEAGRRLRLLRG